MAKKNPMHFRAEFEFHKDKVWVTCNCGFYQQTPTLEGTYALLKAHHAMVLARGESVTDIYKED